MSELRRRMIEDMNLRGFSPKTRQCYVDAVKNLSRYYKRPPNDLSEEEVRQFFLHLLNERGVAASTFRVYLCGIKFFYESTLHRPWHLLDLVRPKKRRKLPVVLSSSEVHQILSLIRTPLARTSLTLVYSCGLRISEAIHLRVSDIDSKRMVVCVRNGKGGKDRYVPLAQRTLELLRAYWRIGRPRHFLFPSQKRFQPLSPSTIQKAFKDALRQSGIQKNASVHTLRHSYATHLLENGVDIRLIQEILGHKNSQTTFLYAHLTRKSTAKLHSALSRLMINI
jgi:integrase/recombinase XerD